MQSGMTIVILYWRTMSMTSSHIGMVIVKLPVADDTVKLQMKGGGGGVGQGRMSTVPLHTGAGTL